MAIDPEIFIARYIVGIDGGAHTGFAIWDTREKEFTDILTVSFWEAYDLSLKFFKHETAFIIEDPGVNKPTFHRNKMKRKVLDRKAQNVGGVKRETKLLGEGIERAGYFVLYVPPSSRKLEHAEFRVTTGYQKRTSQHARDAAMLVFNRGSRIVKAK